jgi:hypothetical protein
LLTQKASEYQFKTEICLLGETQAREIGPEVLRWLALKLERHREKVAEIYMVYISGKAFDSQPANERDAFTKELHRDVQREGDDVEVLLGLVIGLGEFAYE